MMRTRHQCRFLLASSLLLLLLSIGGVRACMHNAHACACMPDLILQPPKLFPGMHITMLSESHYASSSMVSSLTHRVAQGVSVPHVSECNRCYNCKVDVSGSGKRQLHQSEEQFSGIFPRPEDIQVCWMLPLTVHAPWRYTPDNTLVPS